MFNNIVVRQFKSLKPIKRNRPGSYVELIEYRPCEEKKQFECIYSKLYYNILKTVEASFQLQGLATNQAYKR